MKNTINLSTTQPCQIVSSVRQATKKGIAFLLCAFLLTTSFINSGLAQEGNRPAPPNDSRLLQNNRQRDADSPNEILLRASRENPRAAALVPVVMHTLARGLQRNGSAPQSELDRIFDSIVKRHPGYSRELLQQMVQGYNELPEETRNRAEPATLRRLNPAAPLSAKSVRSAVGTLKTRDAGDKADLSLPNFIPGKSLLDDLSDPVPTIKSIEVQKNYEQGATLTIKGQKFPSKKSQIVFVFFQKNNNKFEKIGELEPDSVISTQATVTLPGKYGVTVVPDTEPPVEYKVRAVRKVAANPFENEATESKDVEFSVPHLLKDNVAAIIASPVISQITPTELLAGEQFIQIEAANVNWVKVVAPGLYKNKPVLTEQMYESSPLGAIEAILTSQSNSGLTYGSAEGITCKVIKPSGVDGSPAQLRVTMPNSVYPGEYTLQIRKSSAIAFSQNGGTIRWDTEPSSLKIYSNEFPLRVKPFHFTGTVNKIEMKMVQNKSYGGGHNFNTFCLFTVIANGQSYSATTGVKRLNLPNDSWSFGNEGIVLKETSGGVGLYGPMAVIAALYNFTPGSDNKKTIEAVQTGAAIAGEIAVVVGTYFGGPDVGAMIKSSLPAVKELVAVISNLFYKKIDPKIDLRSVGNTVISYEDVVNKSNSTATGKTGVQTFLTHKSEDYGGVFEFTATYSWRRDEQ